MPTDTPPPSNQPNRPVIFVPSRGVESWKPLLAKPDEHWKDGKSAWKLAHSWEAAGGGFPKEVSVAFAGEPQFADLRPLIVFPEYKVPLTGGSHPSQPDILVLARGAAAGLAIIAVEGKCGEDFGPRISAWRKDASAGKQDREQKLVTTLGLPNLPETIRYQLVHRTAAAVIEATHFGARHAVMLVQSYSPNDHFEDYEAFLNLFGGTAQRGKITRLREIEDKGVVLWAGWVDAR